MSGFILFLVVVFIILPIVPYWVVYSKCGKPGWACLVPIYNTLALLSIVGKPWWWLLLLCIPIVNLYCIIVVLNRLSVGFGHGVGFTIGLIFFPFIFLSILAFSKDKYTLVKEE